MDNIVRIVLVKLSPAMSASPTAAGSVETLLFLIPENVNKTEGLSFGVNLSPRDGTRRSERDSWSKRDNWPHLLPNGRAVKERRITECILARDGSFKSA